MLEKNRPGSAVAILIIGFCLWHMFAVAAYLLPANNDGFMKTLNKFSAPYVLSLSQWQKWDIFSPNPLRRNSVYRIERNAGDRWETAMIMDFSHLGWRERAKELKVLGRLQEDWKALLPSYLVSLCPEIPQASGRDVRLFVQTTVLPSELVALQRTSKNIHPPTEKLLTSVRCPQL